MDETQAKTGLKYHRFHIRDRKVEGQVRVDDPGLPIEFQGYQIFSQPDQPAADLYSAANEWKQYLKSSFPNRGDLNSDDFLYPHVTVPKGNAKAGVVDPGKRKAAAVGHLQVWRELVKGNWDEFIRN
jgi:hypothetical protein